jgi:hypothetical protein
MDKTQDKIQELLERAKHSNTNPVGWWSISLTGMREGVKKEVDASTIPNDWKTLIKSEIDLIDGAMNFVRLSAHCHVEKGHKTYHISISPSKIAV